MNSKQFTESTTSGAIATVAVPLGKPDSRIGKGIYPNEKGGNLLTGKKTNKKFANSIKESLLNEIDFASALGELQLPKEEIIKLSTPAGTIGSRNVFIYQNGKDKIYFFTEDSKIEALVYLYDGRLMAMKNYSSNKGLIYNLFQYIINIEKQKIKLLPIDKLTNDGIKWIVDQLNRTNGFTITDLNNNPISATELYDEWKKAHETGNSGPTGIIISESKNSHQIRENETRIMPMDTFGATLSKLDTITENLINIDNLIINNTTTNEINNMKKSVQDNKKFANTVKESQEQGTQMNKTCHRCGDPLFRFANTIKCHKCNQTWNASPKKKEQSVAEAQTMQTALINALSKVELGSKLDKKIKHHNDMVRRGSKGIMDKAPEGYHIDKKGMIRLGVSEAKLDEEDVIIVPGQGQRIKPGFITKDKDRTDHEVEMALSDLFQSAKNAKQVYELIKDIPESQGIEGWVQEKIIKANDYLNTVREYLEHKELREATIAGKQDNFTIDDIKALEQIRDLETIKARARELIKGKPDRRMKPEKIDYFYNKIDTLTSPMKVIKLMYDLLLAGEGMKTIGSRYSTSSNSYQQRFNEMTGGVIAGGGIGEGYRIVPSIDRERYQEREGLEGPFRARNGKVYYYDPKVGMAYDPDTDFYIDYDELKMMDQDTVEEGMVGKVLAGAALLASLWGIGQREAVQVYDNSPQLQTLIQYHQKATQMGDEAKIQELERRIENHKTRLSLGKGEVMGADDKPIVPKYESSIMKGIQNEQSSDKRYFKRREMEHELGHETNNYAVIIDGKTWKVFADKRQAENIARSLRNKGKKASVGLTGASVSESKNESVTENTDQEHDTESLQKHFGTEVAYDAASHGPKMMQRKDLKGNLYQLVRLPNKNYKATLVTESTDKCPECGGKLVAESELNEEGNKDACYHKVKSRYKVWPSAYASGALVKCRKVGASNWGNKSK